jgi:hypothetical protein
VTKKVSSALFSESYPAAVTVMELEGPWQEALPPSLLPSKEMFLLKAVKAVTRKSR